MCGCLVGGFEPNKICQEGAEDAKIGVSTRRVVDAPWMSVNAAWAWGGYFGHNLEVPADGPRFTKLETHNERLHLTRLKADNYICKAMLHDVCRNWSYLSFPGGSHSPSHRFRDFDAAWSVIILINLYPPNYCSDGLIFERCWIKPENGNSITQCRKRVDNLVIRTG